METKSNQINPVNMEKKSNFRVRVMKYAWQLGVPPSRLGESA